MPDISEIVDVTITVQSAALSRKGFNSLMIIGSDADFGPGFGEFEVRSYTTAAQLGADTDVLPGSASDMATVAFAQSPSVSEVYLSKIEIIPESIDVLYSGPITSGTSTEVKINGVELAGSPVPFNTSNAQTLTDIATVLQAAPEVNSATSDGVNTISVLALTGTIIASDVLDIYTVTSSGGDGSGDTAQSGNIQLNYTANGTGIAFLPGAIPATGTLRTTDGSGAVWIMTYGGSGINAGNQLEIYTLSDITKDGVAEVDLTTYATRNEAAIADLPLDLVIETSSNTLIPATDVTSADLDAIAANDNEWFGLTSVFTTDASIQTISAWGAANKKYGFFRTVVIENTLNLNSNYSSVWYTDAGLTGTAAPLEVAIASRLLAEVPGSYTAAFKSLELVSPTQLSATQEASLRSLNVNQYTDVSGRKITWDGVTTGSGYIDIYIGVLYLEARVAEDVFAYMASVDKVPFTNAGIDSIVGKVQARLDQSVVEEFLSGDPAPLAEAPRVTAITATDKSNRLLPNVTFTATASGAVHMVQINGTVIA